MDKKKNNAYEPDRSTGSTMRVIEHPRWLEEWGRIPFMEVTIFHIGPYILMGNNSLEVPSSSCLVCTQGRHVEVFVSQL